MRARRRRRSFLEVPRQLQQPRDHHIQGQADEEEQQDKHTTRAASAARHLM